MSKAICKLTLDFRSYWRAGSGNSAGAYADALVIKKNGLPYLPGKQLRGLLKKAFTTAQAAKWFTEQDDNLVEKLFGKEGVQGQGLLITPSATLSTAEHNWCTEDKERIKKLYRTINTQAVDSATSTTKIGSLRTMEVTIPLKLSTIISINQDVEHGLNTKDLKQWLNDCCCLITVIGADKNRGFGQVIVSTEEEKS